MIVIDSETRNIISDPNLDLGYMVEESKKVFYRYIIETPAKYKEVVVAEYPETGGKDIAMIEVSPEVGRWIMVDEEDNILPYDIEVDVSGLPKDKATPDIFNYNVYIKYTQKELDEIERQKQEIEEAERLAEEKQKIMDAIPDRVNTIEDAQDDMILLLADIVGGAI